MLKVPERLLTRAEVGWLLSLSSAAVDRLLAQRRLPAVKLGHRTVRVPHSAVQAFIQEAIRTSSGAEQG